MRVGVAEGDCGDTGGEEKTMPADGLGFSFQARHQVGNGNVQEA